MAVAEAPTRLARLSRELDRCIAHYLRDQHDEAMAAWTMFRSLLDREASFHVGRHNIYTDLLVMIRHRATDYRDQYRLLLIRRSVDLLQEIWRVQDDCRHYCRALADGGRASDTARLNLAAALHDPELFRQEADALGLPDRPLQYRLHALLIAGAWAPDDLVHQLEDYVHQG